MFTTYDLGYLVKIVKGKYKGKCGRIIDLEINEPYSTLWLDCLIDPINSDYVELICEDDYENETFRPSRRKERFSD